MLACKMCIPYLSYLIIPYPIDQDNHIILGFVFAARERRVCQALLFSIYLQTVGCRSILLGLFSFLRCYDFCVVVLEGKFCVNVFYYFIDVEIVSRYVVEYIDICVVLCILSKKRGDVYGYLLSVALSMIVFAWSSEMVFP